MASQPEERVEEAIRNSCLRHFKYFFQYSWYDLFPLSPRTFRSKRVDFFFPQINLVVEVQGVQHYKPVAFDGQDHMAVGRFSNQRKRDNELRRLLGEHNYQLLEIPWNTDDIVGYINQSIGEFYGD